MHRVESSTGMSLAVEHPVSSAVSWRAVCGRDSPQSLWPRGSLYLFWGYWEVEGEREEMKDFAGGGVEGFGAAGEVEDGGGEEGGDLEVWG